MNFEETLKLVGIQDKPYFQDKDVCRIFGKTRLTVSKWRNAGLLEAIVICGQNYITRASLKALCEKGESQ